MNSYANSIEHLRDELKRLDLLLQRALLLARDSSVPTAPAEFQGLVITEAEIDALLQPHDFFGARWQHQKSKQNQLQALDSQLEALRSEIDRRCALSEEAGIPLALPSLARRYALSSAEVDILLIALAPELEPRYETLYAYLQDDVTRKRPSVNLTLDLICRSAYEKLTARRLFAPEAALFRHRLLELGQEPHDSQPTLLRRCFRTDENVVAFLLGQPPLSTNGADWIAPNPTTESDELSVAARRQVQKLADQWQQRPAQGLVLRLVSDYSPGLREAAELFSARLGRPLLLVPLDQLESTDGRLRLWLRDVTLRNAVLAIAGNEIPVTGEEPGTRRSLSESNLWSGLRDLQTPVLLLGPTAAFGSVPDGLQLWRLDISGPDFAERQRIWNAALNGHSHTIELSRLADTFHFGQRRIRQTVTFASGVAALRGPERAELCTKDLLDAGRCLYTPHMGRFAMSAKPRHTWSDIVLPSDKLNQLRNIAVWMKHRRQVHGDWGFGAKLSRGKGLNVLFTGQSGTGKTMAAEMLAGELGLELLQIDLSSVVSKYIGETEKNLSTIFREAEHTQAMLFFDEADALFGKRTETKDAHDRYANIEVNYLLQRVEQYEGVAILATNLQRNLDPAFLRRVQEVVEFPFPGDALREQIWRSHFPPTAPRAADIDLAFLARQFKLTGGNIRNIVLNAAFLAAEDSQPISMSHLILATKAELQKEGKLCVKGDFGPYYELIETESVR